MATKLDEKKPIEILPMRYEVIKVEVIGETELIVHNWSEKSKRQMLETMMKKVKKAKEAKDPESEYQAAFYKFPDGRNGFNVMGFKAAIIGALRQYESIPMVLAKQIIFLRSDGNDVSNNIPLVEIIGEPRMREDIARVATGGPDLRYRPGWPQWKCKLTIEFNANILTREMIINLVNTAGRGGVGEWRPSAPKSATGDFGRFRVNAETPIEVLE